MVSRFNNEELKLRQNYSEVMTQFPNYLNDPFAYPSNLNSMDFYWNLFHPQNHKAVQNKRRKRQKEQVSNERLFKDTMPPFDYKKEELIDWLKSLSKDERVEMFSIQNEWLVGALIKMYRRWSQSHNVVFALSLDSKKAYENKDLCELDNLEDYFYIRRKPAADEFSPRKRELIEKAEKELIENIRIYDSNELYDTIVLADSVVQDIDKLITLFGILSDDLAFTKPCRLIYDNTTKNIRWDAPLWFSAHSFQSFPAWIISTLEKVVWTRFFDEKKGELKNSSFSEATLLKINLKYKHDLADFWKSSEKNKKKMLSSVSDSYRLLTSEKNQNNKNSKEIEQNLKLLFNIIYLTNKTTVPCAADVLNYFQSLFQELNDNYIIDKILFTTFDEFGNLTNLICRKLTHKLKNLLADKIAADLIFNEEKEKAQKRLFKNKKLPKQTKKESIMLNSSLESENQLINEQENKTTSKSDLDDTRPTSVNMTREPSYTHFEDHLTETNSTLSGKKTSCKTPSSTKQAINKKVYQCTSNSGNESPLNQGSLFPPGSQNYLKSPEDQEFERNSNDLVSSHRPDEVSTDHSIEEYKKEAQYEIKKKSNNKFLENNSSTLLPALTANNTSSKKISPFYPHEEQTTNQRSVENNIQMDTFGFIEVKAKRKKSLKPTRSRKEGKDRYKKRKEKSSLDNSENTKKEKLEKTNKNKNSKSLTQSPSQKITSEIKRVERPQKNNVAQISEPSKIKSSKLNASLSLIKPSTSSCSPSKIPNREASPSLEKESTSKQLSAQKIESFPKLSSVSPSLDHESLKVSKAKTLAKEYFDAKFHSEIYKHVEGLTKTSNNLTDTRILVYKRIAHCITRIFPMYSMKTKMFGSCATGLALPTSDIDLSVSGIDTYDRGRLCECLLIISEALKNFKWVVSQKPILTATVPVLKLEIDPHLKFDEITNLNPDDRKLKAMIESQTSELNLPKGDNFGKIKVDLTLEGQGMIGYTIYLGYKSSEFAEKMLSKYKSFYIITMILKEFLSNRKLLNTYQGGTSSYCLVIMITAVLQKYGDEGFMESLRRILKFYGEEFQPEKTGIILSGSDPFFPLNHSCETAPLWVLDHNSSFERRNIGQGAYLIKVILHEFEKASKIIDLLQEKWEELVLLHKEKIQKVEDIESIDDIELKSFISSSILDSFLMNQQ